MRVFIVLCALVAACAGQYNYQPAEHGEAVLSQPIAAPLSAPVAQPAPIAEVQKEFYTYHAPEEQFAEGINADQLASSLKKNLRVVFIRMPENRGFEQAALQLAKQSGQQETAIYVLSKQADIGDLAKKLNGLQSSSGSRPEVHFVKYRTPEDAANAQLAIQNQYNQLPGVSRISNEGNAPVLNFASEVAAAPAHAVQAPANEYLPSNAVPVAAPAPVIAPVPDYLPPSLRRFRLK